MLNDALTQQLESTASHLAESRAAGIPVADAARAMRTERRNRAAYAESLFSTILPPAPSEPASMPSVRSFTPSTKTWGDIVETSRETVRPGRGGR